MKDINDGIESPFYLKVSFDKILKYYEGLLANDNEFIAQKARRILNVAEEFPELRDGFTDPAILDKRAKEISIILQDSFSPILTNNEIKTASVPFHNLIFNSSERFKKIIDTAGKNFELEIKNMPENDTYMIACSIILNFCYGYNIDFKRPFFYQIPDANGILRYYKILYNADYTEVFANEKAPKITKDDYEQLLDNFDNIEFWKEKFPPGSYTFKGFVISNIFDVTDDQSISNIKSSLIGSDKRRDKAFMKNFHKIFQSLLGLKDIKVGFSIYNNEKDSFHRVFGVGIDSFLLNHKDSNLCTGALCARSYNTLLQEKEFYVVSDVEKYYKLSKGKAPQYKTLNDQNIKSAILAPIANDNGLLGILEIVSHKAKVLNSLNANKLTDVMPFIVSAVERSKAEEENLVEAIIQQECTTIHPSVNWKFIDSAKQFIKDKVKLGNEAVFGTIVFDHIYPLFGQMDVKGSSEARNIATQKDLSLQLRMVSRLLDKINKTENLPIYEKMKFQATEFMKELKAEFKVDSEHTIVHFLKDDIEPILRFQLEKNEDLKADIEDYFGKVDDNLNLFYYYRKHYDDTIMLINKNMAAVLDEKQIEAQKMYPHYFERFKTDGVEHNMYIGKAIHKKGIFSELYLYNLRLWQLQAMCEMENEYYQNQHNYPLALDVASMILVFNQPLSIRFRMDEKQFDVDGTYNARYEVVKKRVDKANIKGTNERITQNGKMSIVYSQQEDELEYLQYVRFLQSKRLLDDDIEILELEDLQAVTGLKAIRVSILYHKDRDDKAFYTYNDLMKEIKA